MLSVGGPHHASVVLHRADVLARFLDGETRLIFAREGSRAEAELIELPQGEAHAWRQRTRDTLLCPIPDCPAPALKVVARAPRRRDGFSHLPGAGGHAPESLFHIQGKARIAAWLAERHPEYSVVVEQASSSQRERVADVMATAPDGRRWAFEVQYAPLTFAAWTARSESYRAQGIVDVWLFGHTGKQMRSTRTGDAVSLTETQQQIRSIGRRVLWMNPLTSEIAFATQDVSVGGTRFEVLATSSGQLSVEALDEFRLESRGLNSPRLTRLSHSQNQVTSAQSLERERRAAEQAAWEADRPRREAQAAAIAEAETLRHREQAERRKMALRRKQDQLEREWEESPESREITTRFASGTPWWIARDDRVGSGTLAKAWHSILFLRWLDTLTPGSSFALDDAVNAFARHVSGGRRSYPTSLTDSIRDWLFALVDAGWLTRPRAEDPHSPFVVSVEPEAPIQPPVSPGASGRIIPASCCATCGRPLDRREAHNGARNHWSCMNRWRRRDPAWRR